MAAVRRRLKGVSDVDRQMVAILGGADAVGILAVEGACQEALAQTDPAPTAHRRPLVGNVWPLRAGCG